MRTWAIIFTVSGAISLVTTFLPVGGLSATAGLVAFAALVMLWAKTWTD